MRYMKKFASGMMMCFEGGRILIFVIGMGMDHEFTVAQRMNMHKNNIVDNKHAH